VTYSAFLGDSSHGARDVQPHGVGEAAVSQQFGEVGRKLLPPYAPVPGTRMTGVLLALGAQVLGKCMAPSSEACSTV
jgi:hypothetical protein